MKLSEDLHLPLGETEESLFYYLKTHYLDIDSRDEIQNYLKEDFKRFLYTLNLVPEGAGHLLEIGSNPYFTTMLLKKFRKYQISCTNYFEGWSDKSEQTLTSDNGESITFPFYNVNIEKQTVPFENKFDVILLCEVIEHFTEDPLQALLNIKNALKQDGYLILTTPNVNRLENIARMLSGANIYDPYSNYGQHGRHNREYNKHELFLLLTHIGFDIEVMFCSDVHENRSENYFPLDIIETSINVIKNRELDLGQYIFVRAKNTRQAQPLRPRWLFRSYPEEKMHND